MKTKEEVQAEIATDLKRAVSSRSGRPLSVQVSAHLDAAATKIASLPTIKGERRDIAHDYTESDKEIEDVLAQCEEALRGDYTSDKHAALSAAIEFIRGLK